jgi:ligand-binding sensor domain-containing protein
MMFFAVLNRLLFIFTILLGISKGQTFEPYFYQLNTNNGLPSNTIYSLLQSKNGVVYIGHEEGITRYNGSSFKHIKNRGKGKSLNNLIEDDNGKVLSASFFGDLVSLNSDTLQFLDHVNLNITGRPILKQLNKRTFVHDVNNLFYLKDNTLNPIFISNKNIYITDIDTASNGCLLVAYFLSNKLAINIYDRNNKLLNTTLSTDNIDGKCKFVTINDHTMIYQFNKNKLYTYTKDQIRLSTIQFKAELGYTKWSYLKSIEKNIYALVGYDGVYFFNNKGDEKMHLLKGSQVSDIIKDKEGNLWISSLNEGVYIFPDLNILKYSLNDILGKNDYVNRAIQTSQNKIILGSFKGKLICLDENYQIEKCFEHDIRSDIQSIYYDKKNKNIFTYCDKLYKLNEKTFAIEKTYTITSTKDIAIVNDTIFCATSMNLNIIHGDRIVEKFNGTWINTLHYDSIMHELWVGTNKGLFRYNPSTQKEIKEELLTKIKINPVITKIVEDTKNNLYFLVSNYGVIKRTKHGLYSTILSNSDVKSIKTFNNLLYVLFNDQVWLFDLQKNITVYKLNQTKGMDSHIIDFYKTNNNYIVIHPNSIKLYKRIMDTNFIKPSIQLQDIKGTYKRILPNKLSSEYTKNILEFTLEVLPNIRSKNQFTFKYRLRDIDEDWVTLSNEKAEYNFKYQQLDSKNYIFEAIAINEDGVESSVFTLYIEVTPPFWKKWWFIIISIVLIITILKTLYNWRIHLIYKKNKEKLDKQRSQIKLLSAELTAIRSQMNPHFIFNTLSSIQAKVLTAKSEDAYNDISKFSQLIRSVLEYSNKEYILLAKEIDFIKNYLHLESSRFEGKIHFNLDIDKETDIHFLEIPTLITIPFIENAIKHGLLHKEGDKTLNIKINGNQMGLNIIISDNGIGRARSNEINIKSLKEHKSFAIEATNKRIERINLSDKMKVNIKIEDLETGTQVTISIKYVLNGKY